MPRIGMRIIKTSIAVFLCFVCYVLRGAGSPFYSAIAAILCMKLDVESSAKVGLNRIIGTLIGGIFGTVGLLVELQVFGQTSGLEYLLYAAFISVMIIPVIYFTVLIHKSQASYLACVVFLSITVMHGGDINPFIFAVNRVIDTLVGIVVALAINSIHLPRKKNEGLLLVADLGGILSDAQGQLDNFVTVKLNHMLKSGANLAIFTSRSIAKAAEQLEGLHLRLPVIAMSGAVLYDLKEHHYVKTVTISYALSEEIGAFAQQHNLNPYYCTITNDILHIYYQELSNPAEQEDYKATMTAPLKNYVCAHLPKEKEVIRIQFLDMQERINAFCAALFATPLAAHVIVRQFESKKSKGYVHLEIYSKDVDKLTILQALKEETQSAHVAAFVRHKEDMPMLAYADFGFATETADLPLKEPSMQNSHVKSVKVMEKLLYSKRQYAKMLKEKREVHEGNETKDQTSF